MQAFDLGQSAGAAMIQEQDRDPGQARAGHDTVTDHGDLSRQLTSEAVSAFGAVVEEMGRIRELHTEICGNLDRFADLVGEADGSDALIGTLEEDVRQLGAALCRFSELAVSAEARGRLRSARADLASIDKCGHVLTAIASLMGTTRLRLVLGCQYTPSMVLARTRISRRRRSTSSRVSQVTSSRRRPA